MDSGGLLFVLRWNRVEPLKQRGIAGSKFQPLTSKLTRNMIRAILIATLIATLIAILRTFQSPKRPSELKVL